MYIIYNSNLYVYTSINGLTKPSTRVVYGVGLRPFACWDCGLEFRKGLLSVVSLCVGLITRPEES